MTDHLIDDPGSGESALPSFNDRAAWYADPYDDSRERWWDGRRWTSTVRPASATPLLAPAVRPARRLAPPSSAGSGEPEGADSGAAPGAREPRPEFRTALMSLENRTVRLRRVQATFPQRYELVEGERRVGSLALHVGEHSALMACAEGRWQLRARHRLGGSLAIQTPGGELVGSVARDASGAGGTLSLVGGPEVVMRRSVRGWRLQTTNSRRTVADIRGFGPSRRTIRIGCGLAGVPGLPTAVLAACAVLMLEHCAPARMHQPAA
jgi:hypothetical protein